MAKATATLSQRELNRATLARQLLLAREKLTPAKAIERLAGMQAQLARPPYIGLWSRVAGFTREPLTRAIQKREVVRGTLYRATLHLVTAKDFRRLRPSLQPMLDRAAKGILKDKLDGIDVAALATEARAFFDAESRTFDELRTHLAKRHPTWDERAMGYVVRCRLPLVQVPADGSTWGYPGTADFAAAESWLGTPIDGEPDPAELVRRYLAAFGPATPADAQTWSGLQGLKETFEALRPTLRTFRDDGGRELFDLPKAPRPDADTVAPVRFLPDYDNLVLGHSDRSRLVAAAHRPALIPGKNLQIPPTFLVDGMVAGTWKIERKKKVATLTLVPFGALSRSVRGDLEAEGTSLLVFVEPDADQREVRIGKP